MERPYFIHLNFLPTYGSYGTGTIANIIYGAGFLLSIQGSYGAGTTKKFYTSSTAGCFFTAEASHFCDCRNAVAVGR